jgi:hypothetical protein
MKYLKSLLTSGRNGVTASATSARRNQWKKSSTRERERERERDRYGVPFSATVNTLDLWVIFAGVSFTGSSSRGGATFLILREDRIVLVAAPPPPSPSPSPSREIRKRR